jgi:hypothetical protein
MSFVGCPIEGVMIDGSEFSLDEFSEVAIHFLAGGMFGWLDGKTPDVINASLTTLFEQYDQVDGRWVRKPITG